jgi:gliding motility-associated protein GldC
MTKRTDIALRIDLDENKVPETIFWDAPDGGVKNEEASAVFLSIWDPKAKDTLRIDLWTKEMPIDDMKRFLHQTLLSMADTLERATNQDEMAIDMRDFAKYYAEKLELIKKKP